MQSRWIISVLVFLLCISGRPARGADVSAATATTPPGELLASDTPRTTRYGATFVAPGGWWIEARGNAIVLSPEGDSHLVLVDVHRNDAAAAAYWHVLQSPITNTVKERCSWRINLSYQK
jgi:hypothetical protein